MSRFFLIISGPTGVGKTDFVHALTESISCSVTIINGDMGQMYTPLRIGTAKPDLQKEKQPHRLFDILNEPKDFTVMQYRALLCHELERAWMQKRLPIIVGGSGFYLKSLLFPPISHVTSHSENNRSESDKTEAQWQKLHAIDPVRAQAIHPHDVYRVERALSLWKQSRSLPSEYKPLFDPPGTFFFLFLNRDRDDLYSRINERTRHMFHDGWIAEVEQLSLEWRVFLKEKKIIGYPEIIAFLEKPGNIQEVITTIQSKTRAYAKRQITFWRSLQKHLTAADPEKKYARIQESINLTKQESSTYIKQIIDEMNKLNRDNV